MSFNIDKKADYHDYDYHDYDYHDYDYHDYDYYDRDRHRYQHFYNHNKRLGVRGCCYQGDKKIGSGEKVCWIKKCSPKQLYYLY